MFAAVTRLSAAPHAAAPLRRFDMAGNGEVAPKPTGTSLLDTTLERLTELSPRQAPLLPLDTRAATTVALVEGVRVAQRLWC